MSEFLVRPRGIIYRVIFIFLLAAGGSDSGVRAQNADLSFLLTAPERTGFDQTTRYDEVIAFLGVAAAQHPQMHMTTFGYTAEGRAMPLIVFGDVADASPDAVLESGKLRVFVQGNIHAGEVAGKEALLMLIRSLASGEHASWTDSLVLLFAPIYNSDGNERVSLFNRPRQNGPLAGMGQRPNAQGLDLNRDHMKVKSPEARSLIALMNAYDPYVAVDLHTTNGTRHGYHLTYSPALNPNTDPGIDSFVRDTFLPAVTDHIRDRTGWEYYYYGNLPFRRGDPGWYTFDHRPRFNNNYIGLRNRIPILSEAYAYLTFEDRILASLYFVEEILNYAGRHVSEITATVTTADDSMIPGMKMGVRFEHEMNSASSSILMGAVVEKRNPYSGTPYFERIDSTYVVEMAEYGAFCAVETESLPDHYWVSNNAAGVVASYLETHGIRYEAISEDVTMMVNAFNIDSTSTSPREFQQLKERTIWGSYRRREVVLEKGSLYVPGDQPLSRLLFYLIEPRSDDGLVNWAQMDKWVEAGMTYPVYQSLK